MGYVLGFFSSAWKGSSVFCDHRLARRVRVACRERAFVAGQRNRAEAEAEEESSVGVNMEHRNMVARRRTYRMHEGTIPSTHYHSVRPLSTVHCPIQSQ